MNFIIDLITIFNTGFSIVSCLLLIVIGLQKADALLPTASAKLSMLLMLLALAALQFFHYLSLVGISTVFTSSIYALILFFATSSFYLFCRAFLQPETESFRSFLILLPAFFVWLIPTHIVIPLTFALGTGYTIYICRQLYQMRDSRKHFQLEMGIIVSFAFNALLILIVGLSAIILQEKIFVITYANLIGFSLLAMIYLQLRFPDLTEKAQEIVAMRYAASTLKNVEAEPLLDKLKNLLSKEKIYKDENLSLSSLAEQLDLTSHQLSELINRHFDLGFSRLVREYRIEDAKSQLINQPRASVLSIGLDVGFSSQSNFYTAFKEITGETPGQFRKRMGISEGLINY